MGLPKPVLPICGAIAPTLSCQTLCLPFAISSELLTFPNAIATIACRYVFWYNVLIPFIYILAHQFLDGLKQGVDAIPYVCSIMFPPHRHGLSGFFWSSNYVND